ncbi:uncharacterized protein E6C27_scaffold238G00090 [Cucumis melo var. makuwa]|uniref:Ubiquitin-like protease family profile domain-containing protein n=1 Tax=Cucumis melo var. makuwa TaxID=1194695 RepID=A0A5A7VR15_CUCMM|nr:uncharacterized protein E6C27_scaffold238G00090 [Cucumis melo var. makuwa]
MTQTPAAQVADDRQRPQNVHIPAAKSISQPKIPAMRSPPPSKTTKLEHPLARTPAAQNAAARTRRRAKRLRPNTSPRETSLPKAVCHPNSPATRRPAPTTCEDPCRRPVFTLVILQQLFGYQSARFRAFSIRVAMVANHAYIDTLVVGAFVVDGRSKKVIMKTARVSFRQFKSWLTTQYIIPFMDELQLLIDPPSLYAHIIDKLVWQEFVRSRMSLEFQKLRREQQDRRKRSKYTHNMSRRGYANLAEDMKNGSFKEQDFGRANMWKKARTKKDGGYINEDVQQVANEIDEILDKAPNEESPNDALTHALGTPEYGGRVRGVGGFITPIVYFHQEKPRKSNEVDTTQQIIDENEALRKHIRELEQKVQSIPTSEHGSCSKSKVQEKEKVLENVVKEKKGIATSVPPVSLTSKKKVVEEEKVKEEEVIATTPMTKNEVKSSRPMTKEVEVTSEPSNLPIQLKYILRYAKRKVSKYVFVDPSLISAGHSTREIRARNLCSRLMTSKQDQLVVAPYNPGDHWSLVIINPYDDVVYHLDSLRTSSRDDIKYVTNMALTIFQSQKNSKKTRKTTFWKAVKCPLQVGTIECGYYVMRYMREILSKDTSIITDAIDTRNSYSQLELDEVRVEWAEFLSRYI